MSMRDRHERIANTDHQGRHMRNRRHLTHYLIACAVAVGSVGLASVAAGPADAASPNDFLCYVAGSSQVAAVGTAYINALQVELSWKIGRASCRARVWISAV